MILRLLACAAVLFAAFPQSAPAEKPRPARPAGKSAEVQVRRGGSVRIALRGFERNLNRLVYRPLEKPRHGTLSDLEQYDGPDRQGPGYITYTHGDDEDSVEDSFTFEAKAPITGLSGRGKVTVTILDAPARLAAPTVLDFGRVAIGDPAVRRDLDLANVGGGVLRGRVAPPAPFSVGDDGNFVLRRGQALRIPVTFSPQSAGPYSFPVQPAAGDASVVTFKGEAVAPLEIEAAGDKFTETGDKSRVASVVVKNLSVRPRKISVVLPPGSPVDPVSDVNLGPGESADIKLRISPRHKDYLAPFGVLFQCEGYAERCDFSAPASGADLAVVSPPDFGDVKPGAAAEALLVLRNDGGSVAEARLLPHESIKPAHEAPAITIAPGARYEMPLEMHLGENPGPPGNLGILFQGRQIPVAVAVRILPPDPKPQPSPGATPVIRDAGWLLNTDIKYAQLPEGPALEWSEKSGWSNFVLQHQPDGKGPWQDYRWSAPQEGLLGGLSKVLGGMRHFLTRKDVTAEISAEPQTAGRTMIGEANAARDVWRLTAVKNSGGRQPVTDPFLVKDHQLATAPAEAGSATAAGTSMRAVGPQTPIAASGIKSDQAGVLLQVAFARNLGVRGFRLECGAMVPGFDAKTGRALAPVFEKIDPPGVQVEKLAPSEAAGGGQQMTVCAARITGLPPGTRSFWRIVPEGSRGDLAPTTALVVDTQPSPPVPWNTVLLLALALLLAVVLYLRWKTNRPPAW